MQLKTIYIIFLHYNTIFIHLVIQDTLKIDYDLLKACCNMFIPLWGH